jgi:hypothetical protein
MRAGRWVLLIWAIFVVRGCFYACVLPLWGGFDEYSHYARIEYLATLGREPSRDTPVPPDVADSLARVPVNDVGISIDDYWRLTDAERNALVPPANATIYEAQQPPVFYWLMASVYWATPWLSLSGRVMLFRLLCVLLASAAIPFTFLIGRKVFGGSGPALAAAALAALLPLAGYTATHISNDALAIALGSAVVWLTLRRSVLALALVLGLALLTKAYFLAFLPAIALLLLVRPWWKTAAALAGAAALAAPWYWHTWTTTGSLSGHGILMHAGSSQVIQSIPHFPLIKSLDFGWTSFIWMANWTFVPVRSWMYRAIALLLIPPLCGVLLLLLRKRRADVAILSAFAGFFALASLYLGVVSFAAGASPGASAWYACCVMAVFSVLVIAGLRTLFPPQFRPAAVLVLAASLTALDQFGTYVYALPYYTGLIAHTPSGGLPAVHLSQLAGGGFPIMLRRLTLEKPDWIDGPVLILLWCLFLVATGAGLAAAFYCSRQDNKEV